MGLTERHPGCLDSLKLLGDLKLFCTKDFNHIDHAFYKPEHLYRLDGP